MDATKTIFKQTAFFILTALLFAASGQAQSQLVPSANSVGLSGTNQTVFVSVSSSTGTAIPFTIQKGAGEIFYNVSSDSSSTPANLTVTIQGANVAGCQNTTCTGTITLHPTSGGGTDVTISVTFTPGSGGGGGGSFIVLSSTSVPLSVTTQGQSQTSSVNVSTQNGSTVACTAGSNATWLTFPGGVTSTSITLSGVAQALTFTANSTFLGANSTQTGTVTISCPTVSQTNSFNVVFTVGAGGGGGNGTLSVNPSTVTFAYPSGTSNQTVTTTSTNGTTATYNSYATTNSGGNWLLANGTSSVSGPWSVANGVSVSVNTSVAATLALSGANSYTGQVVIYNPSNQSDFATITVTLNVSGGGGGGTGVFTLTPSTVLMGYPNASSAVTCSSVTASSSCNVSVTSNSGLTTFYAYANSINGGSWLQLNGVPGSYITGTTSQGLNLSLNPNGLGSLQSGNTYNAQVYVCNPSNCSSDYSVLNVNLQVGSGGTGTGGIAGPTSLSFAYQLGQQLPTARNVTIGYSGSYTATATVNTGTQQWLKVSGLSSVTGTGPGFLNVSVDPTGLTANTYQGTITVTTSSTSQNIDVTLVVSNGAVINNNVGSINLFGSTSQSTLLTLVASDGSAIAVTATTQQSWITVGGATSSTTPASYLVTVDPSTLCNGLNVGAVNISAPTAANSTDSIPVVALVTGSTSTNCGGGTGNLTFNPATALTFSAPSNTSIPSGQTLVVSSTSVNQATVATVTSNGGNWLLINNASYPNGVLLNVPNTLTISANPAGLATGTYNGQLQFSANGITQNVSVTLTVGGGSGNITVNPTSITVTTPAGQTPTGQTISVTNASGASTAVQFTVNTSTTSGGSWLTLSGANGAVLSNGASVNTPATLTANINPSGLTAGQQYTGSIVLSPNGGTAVTIPVSFTIQSQTVVSATPTDLTFNYTLGDAPPATQAVSVTGTGQNPLPFSAIVQTQSGGNWLTVTPTTGNTPATLAVGLDTSALTAAGTFTGTIVVAGTGSATGSTTINVTLKAIAPLPTITQIGSAASYVGGAIAPGEIITIFGTGLGPTPAVSSPTVDPSTGLVTTKLGGVQVLINGFACPMIYASNTQISAVVPYEVKRFLSATILVQYLGQTSNGISAAVSPSAPGIFTANASGTGPGAILNANTTQNAPGNPASKGETVAIYMTGEGETAPAGVTGKVTTVATTSPLTPQPLLPIGVLIDGQPAAVSFYGEAPTLVSGVLQVNVVIPANARSGNLPLVINIGSGSSQTGVTVSVR